MEILEKGLLFMTVVDLIGTAVTLIDIVVCLASIVQNHKSSQEKSNRTKPNV